jgi:simple sugar transport system ATP-binding protein
VSTVLARLDGVERRFGSVRALQGADLEIRSGEVHGVLGANGAGKSTLLNILGGMLSPDAGRIEIGGAPVRLDTPRDAWAHGVALVHQHFTLVPRLSTLENVALGRGRRPDLRSEVERLMDQTGLRVPLDATVEELGVGDRQRIEILKALLRDPRILVLDEPTAVLTPIEIEGLFTLLGELAAEGRGVVLVAHKLDEVLSVADHVTVLRSGRTVLTGVAAEQDVDGLVRAMVGTETADAMALGLRGSDDFRSGGPGGERERGRVVARLEGVGVRRPDVGSLEGIDLDVRSGEIVGVAGVEGNGQQALALVLSGRAGPERGRVELPEAVGFVPQDRSTEGLVADFDLAENVALALHRDPEYRRGVWLRWAELRAAAEEIRERYGVAAPSVETRAGALSGGNQQRVVVGRELAVGRDLLVAENPTRGLDVAAAAFVHEELRRLAARGVAIVLISTDLDEVLGLSDIVYALTRGRLHTVPAAARSREGVGALMLAGRGSQVA